jgi:predicted flap endonuclease-1-like 5' DNA nuclease
MLETVLAFALGVIVGLLVAWYPSRQQVRTCQAQLDNLRNALKEKDRRLKEHGADVEHLRGELLQREETIRDLSAQLDWRKITIGQLTEVVEERESHIQTLISRTAEVAAPVIEPDNLKRVEGIGPKISQLLQDAGIMTFAQLATTAVSRLQQILADADLTALANPTTWPEQAKLAAEGDWEGLAALQDELKGGRRE